MSTANEITRLGNAKAAIASAITEKGVTVPAATKLDGMASLIGQIEQGGGVQSDWNQMDDTAADFIKNKPFCDELVEIIPETVVVGEYDEDFGVILTKFDSSLRMYAPDRLCVSFDGVQYNCSATEDEGSYMYGNFGFMGGQDTGEPFFMILIPYVVWLVALYDSDAHNVSISEVQARPIDKMYLPTQQAIYLNFSDRCLYNDVELTIKTRRFDILSVLDNGFVVKVVTNGVVVATGHPITVYYQNPDYAALDICVEGEIRTCYTAEYTPET